jgi:hypothetical protein
VDISSNFAVYTCRSSLSDLLPIAHNWMFYPENFSTYINASVYLIKPEDVEVKETLLIGDIVDR